MSKPRYLVKLYGVPENDIGNYKPDLEIIEENDLLELIRNDGWEKHSEYVAEYTDKFYQLGSKEDLENKKVWILIGIYHEYGIIDVERLESGDMKNDINAIIYAENLEEAKSLLKTHPEYLADINRIKKDDSSIEEMDVLAFIFGDEGQKLAQLCGNFGELDKNLLKYFTKVATQPSGDS